MRKKVKEMLSALGERYKTFEHDGGYLLYDKERNGKRSVNLYLGKFYVPSDGGYYVFMDGHYDTVESLVDAMEKYNSTLPFDAELYNPMLTKNCMVECCIHDYLVSLGFERDRSLESFNDGKYILKDMYGEDIMSVRVDVDDDGSGHVFRSHGSSFTETPFSDLYGAVSAVNTIVSTYVLSVNSRAMIALSNMTKSRSSVMLDKEIDMKRFEVIVTDAREKMIKELEDELERLKSI